MPEQDATPAEQGDAVFPDLMEVALLHDLTRWREALARSIARNNLELRSDQITAAVNRILFPLLFHRIAEDRRLLAAGTLANLRDIPEATQLIRALAPFADTLYADSSEPPPGSLDPGNDLRVEERVICSIFDTLTAPERRYDCAAMRTGALARVLMQYLTRTIRRSATHQATVVDTHDTVISGGMVIPPLPLIDYMVRQALDVARKNRSAREILPLRVFDPACGSGTILLAAYRHMLEMAGGPALTFDERREILFHSVHGLDTSRHAVAVTRMLLVLELCDGMTTDPAEGDFLTTVLSALRDLCHTTLCGNALVGPEIVHDESWMFCPARDRHKLNLFSYRDRFPEIIAGGGFDVIVCNPPEGMLEQREWIQQYFQRHYCVYHPRIDRSAYFLEKSFSLVIPGGTVSCILSDRWLHGSAGSPLRELLNTRQIGEIVDLPHIPAGKPGAGLCLISVRASPPARTFRAVIAGPEFFENPDVVAARHSFPVNPLGLDEGGWALHDTRAEEILRKVQRHSTPLEEFVMGQVHAGMRVLDDDPHLVDEALAREWFRKDPRCRPLIRRVVAGPSIGRYDAGDGEKFLILIPQGWTLSHPGSGKKPWEWFRHRHPLIARHLQGFMEILKARAGPDGLWWETACDEFWQEPQKKILFPSRFARPVFVFDAGRGIGDAGTMAIPSAGLYLAGVLNSRLLRFVFEQVARQPAPGRKIFSWDNISGLPVYTPDFDRPEDLARHNRIEKLVRRLIDLEKNGRVAPAGPGREALQKKIQVTDRQIDLLVYELYGLTAEEIAVVESAVTEFSPS
jgi:hypothetical protein